MCTFPLASNPRPSTQFFSQPWKNRDFFHGYEKNCVEGLGFEATFPLPFCREMKEREEGRFSVIVCGRGGEGRGGKGRGGEGLTN